MNNKYFFVLGAPDHEMQEIERVVKEAGHQASYATKMGTMVHSYEAYSADDIRGVLPSDVTVVTVECFVMGLPVHLKIDHHREGDAGYGMPPDRYLEGSSLGQVLKLLGLEPTPAQRVIAAADHCLTAAYHGLCPGVSPDALREFRETTRAKARNLPLETLQVQIQEATELLETAPKISLGDTPVAWLEEPPAEVSEASARMGIPYAFIRRERDGRMKGGIRSAPSEVVQYWLNRCGLRELYGDPQRGFAGGYF